MRGLRRGVGHAIKNRPRALAMVHEGALHRRDPEGPAKPLYTDPRSQPALEPGEYGPEAVWADVSSVG